MEPEVTKQNAKVVVRQDLDEHLAVIIDQRTYDQIMELVQRAEARPNSKAFDFDYWLAKAVDTGFRTITAVQDRNEGLKTIVAAQKGNPAAIRRLLAIADKYGVTAKS